MVHALVAAFLLSLVCLGVQAAPVSGQGTWETTLQARDADPNTPGIEAYYDTVLNITWLADAALAKKSSFGISGIDSAGKMTSADALAWVTAMNANSYLGMTAWRLPGIGPVIGSTFNYSYSYIGTTDRGYNIGESGTAYAGSTGSEMAHMFYLALNNKGACDPLLSSSGICSFQPSGWGLSNTGPFNLEANGATYWSGTPYTPDTQVAWYFHFVYGDQNTSGAGNTGYAWAVLDGDVLPANTVPIPAAVWLFGSALGVMGWMRRKAPA